jgi:outer membrane protein assembly factor BamD
MFRNPVRNFVLIFALAMMASCGEYNKVLKSNDIDYKYQKAVEYYDKGEYSKALSLFDELGTLFRGSSRSEIVNYYIANCHYNLKDYYFANYYYKNFAKTYPNSAKAEECLFASAYCSYKNSPVPSLDQQDTEQAIDEFQLFLNKYPNTSLKDSANKMIEELRVKLERKAYNNARLYYQTENYKSATIALNNLLRTFPESDRREEIEFLIIKSSYLLAINSIETKKEERLTATIESYHKFVDSFQNSKYIKEAESYYSNALRELDKMKF